MAGYDGAIQCRLLDALPVTRFIVQQARKSRQLKLSDPSEFDPTTSHVARKK